MTSPKRPLATARRRPQIWWAVGFGSLLLHGLLLWAASRLSPIPTAPPERLMRVSLAPLDTLPTPSPSRAPSHRASTQPKRARHQPKKVIQPTAQPKPTARPLIHRRPQRVQPPRPRPTPLIVKPLVAKARPTRTTKRMAKIETHRAKAPLTSPPPSANTTVQSTKAPSPTSAPNPTSAPFQAPTTSILPNVGQDKGIGPGKGVGNGSGQGTGSGSGSGSGTGSGVGSGNGSGTGAGNGSGTGSGNGSGNGSGTGSGNGSGNGTGNGSGSGAGTGRGNGSGNGSGDGNGNGGGGSGGGGGGGGGGGNGGTQGGGGPYGLGGRQEGEPPRHIVYVLDVSPSMEPRIERAQDELKSALADLQPGESFDIIAFSNAARRFKKQLIPASSDSVAQADKWIKNIQLDYGTNLEKAMKQAFSFRGVNVVVVITDGVPTMGELNFDRLAARVRELNQGHARIFTIGLKGNNGTDEEGVNKADQEFEAARLLQQIARDSGGQFKIVPD